MNASLSKRQITWMCIRFIGLFFLAACAFRPEIKYKHLNNSATSETFNLGFECVSNPNGLPDGWFSRGDSSYYIQLDSVVKRSGKYALRINAKEEATEQDIGFPAQTIPAIYKGKNITLKAFMKFEDVEQPIGLFLRIDGISGRLQYDNMLQRGITGTEEWKEYSVTLPLPEEAKLIHIGAILSGNGTLWVDDFQVLIDDIELSLASLKPMSKAEKDTEFDAGSKINIPTYTLQTVANLELLGRIWGFLKYYHPAIATGDYNWDAELFRIMPAIIHVQTPDERNRIFVEWIDHLGKFKPARSKNKTERGIEVKLQPDLAWIENPELGKTLSMKIKKVKEARKNAEHYYIDFHQGVKNPIFKNENPYVQINYSDDSGMRLLALFRYWNMIEYFFPYKHLTTENWNTVLGKFIPLVLDAKTELEYKLELLQLIAHVNDTHANIAIDRTINGWRGWRMAPYDISYVEGKAVVTSIWNRDTTQPSELKKGDIITNINGKLVEEIFEERKPFTPASNSSVQLSDIARELLRTNAESLSLQIIRNEKFQTCEVATSTNRFPPNTFKASHRLLSPSVGYIWTETLRDDSIPIIMEKFRDTKGVIIDLRCYPRIHSTAYTLGSYLTPKPSDFVKHTVGSIEQPGKFTFAHTNMVGNNNAQVYNGKVVIIVNERTMSRSEYHTMAYQTAPNATVIGSTTAASDGDISNIVLPGNVQTRISGIGIYYPDGRETQRIGIAIDEEVKPTIRGIIEGRDELLERAKQIIYD